MNREVMAEEMEVLMALGECADCGHLLACHEKLECCEFCWVSGCPCETECR